MPSTATELVTIPRGDLIRLLALVEAFEDVVKFAADDFAIDTWDGLPFQTEREVLQTPLMVREAALRALGVTWDDESTWRAGDNIDREIMEASNPLEAALLEEFLPLVPRRRESLLRAFISRLRGEDAAAA